MNCLRIVESHTIPNLWLDAVCGQWRTFIPPKSFCVKTKLKTTSQCKLAEASKSFCLMRRFCALSSESSQPSTSFVLACIGVGELCLCGLALGKFSAEAATNTKTRYQYSDIARSALSVCWFRRAAFARFSKLINFLKSLKMSASAVNYFRLSETMCCLGNSSKIPYLSVYLIFFLIVFRSQYEATLEHSCLHKCQMIISRTVNGFGFSGCWGTWFQ